MLRRGLLEGRTPHPTRRVEHFTLTGGVSALAAGTALLIGLLMFGFLQASTRSILDTSEQLRRGAALRVEKVVANDLGKASRATASLAEQVRLGVIDPNDRTLLERALFAALVNEPSLAEVSFTRAQSEGMGADGHALMADEGRWELAVYRATASLDSAILTRRIQSRGHDFALELRARAPRGLFDSGEFVSVGTAPDPTMTATFQTAASRDAGGRAIWSDLHWSELDPEHRRVVMTVQMAAVDAAGRFAGVARVGLFTDTIDEATRVRVEDDAEDDPHRIILCDADGRLLTPAQTGGAVALSGDDLRFDVAGARPEIAAALTQPALHDLAEGDEASAEFSVGGRSYLATYRGLQDTQDWIVGIVVPKRHYTARLEAVRNRFLGFAGLAIALLGGCGAFVMRAIRRGFGQVDAATSRMRSYDFAAQPVSTPFRDVEAVLENLERAKTAMRTLGKYAPVDLVRDLFRANREPKLGGELADVTLLFTDIEGFTSLAETITPDALADALAAYFDTMTRAVRSTGGIVDKFIGDAVMAMWNAPAPVANHASCACRAAIECRQSLRALYASPAWRGLPPLVTRFGLHTDRVLVGHFGASERMSFTALGDGVNLASRLEALGKQYGVTMLVSEAVVEATGGMFAFRRLDRVAVKGKAKAVVVYELLGVVGEASLPYATAYEAALEDYWGMRFEAAELRLAPIARSDPAARVLLERCRTLRSDPPATGWDGVYVAKVK